MFEEFKGKDLTEIVKATVSSPYMYIGLAVGVFLTPYLRKRKSKWVG